MGWACCQTGKESDCTLKFGGENFLKNATFEDQEGDASLDLIEIMLLERTVGENGLGLII
jgi:hypothetical protein